MKQTQPEAPAIAVRAARRLRLQQAKNRRVFERCELADADFPVLRNFRGSEVAQLHQPFPPVHRGSRVSAPRERIRGAALGRFVEQKIGKFDVVMNQSDLR